jgi:hypothetical protein
MKFVDEILANKEKRRKVEEGSTALARKKSLLPTLRHQAGAG